MHAADASALSPALLETAVNSFPTDSREVKAGDLFFAFSQPEFAANGFNGEFRDAHTFAPMAFTRGAIACVGRRDRFEEHSGSLGEFADRFIFTDDVIFAFQQLAHRVYMDWGGPVVGITGSAGKTTVKELAAYVLESGGMRVLKNERNLNTGLGLPMTVLKLAAGGEFDVAVLEMGMSTPNHEIRRLCEITPLTVALELNVLPVHLEYLGSITNIQAAKAELVQGLKPEGTAILNADDSLVAEMVDMHSGPCVTFGIEKEADVMGLEVDTKELGRSRFRLRTPGGTADVDLALPGMHNVSNALAAAAAGHVLGLDCKLIAGALSAVAAPPQRGEILEFEEGFRVLDDSYNSNPDALLKVVRALFEDPGAAGRVVVVAGEMLELGREEAELHRAAGRDLAGFDIGLLIGVRGLAEEMVGAARSEGLGNAVFCSDSGLAGDCLLREVCAGDLVLVKGSRGVRTERVIDKLKERFSIKAA